MSREQIADLVGVDPVTVTGAIKILIAAGLISRSVAAKRYVVAGLQESNGVGESVEHPFEARLRELFTTSTTIGLRGTPLRLYLGFGHLSGYGTRTLEATHEQLNSFFGITSHTLLTGLEKLRVVGLIEKRVMAKRGTFIRLLLGVDAPGSGKAYPQTPFLKLISRRADEGDLNRGSSKIGGNAWSCMLAVAYFQGFGRSTDRATHPDVERVLYGGESRNACSPMAAAVRMGLIELDEADLVASSRTVIRLAVDIPTGGASELASDQALVLTTMLAWRHGLIREIGTPALRAQLTGLRAANLTRRTFTASNSEFLRQMGKGSDGDTTALRTLHEFHLMQKTGSHNRTQRVLCLPTPPPRSRLWDRDHQEILNTIREKPPVLRSGRAALCDMVARMTAARRDETGPTRRADIVGFLYVATKAGFDPHMWTAIATRSLARVGVSEGRRVLGRLVDGGYLHVRPQGGNRAHEYSLQPSDEFRVPVTVEDAQQFTAIIEKLVTPAEHLHGKTTSAATVVNIPLTDVWLYLAVAVDLDFQFERARRFDLLGLARLSASAVPELAERLARLHNAELLRCRNTKHELTVELIHTERTGAFWPKETPRKRIRRCGVRKPKAAVDRGEGGAGSAGSPAQTTTRRRTAAAGVALRADVQSKSTLRTGMRPPLDVLEDPVKLTWVVSRVGRAAGRPDKLADKMKRLNYPIVTVVRRNYCQRKDAIALFPRLRARLVEDGEKKGR